MVFELERHCTVELKNLVNFFHTFSHNLPMSKKDVKIPCAHCGCTDLPLHTCSKCKGKQYCGRPCQLADWKGGHKAQCGAASHAAKAEEVPTGEVCAICLEELNDDMACLLPCGHKFDVACVDAMRKFGVTHVCPCCRAKLPPSAETQFAEAVYRHACVLGMSQFDLLYNNDHVSTKDEIGKIYAEMTPEQKKENHRIVRLYKASAEQGYATAQNHLGVMYKRGLFVCKSDVKAARWYRKAAIQGDMLAQLNMGGMYRSGLGVPVNYPAAMDMYKKASEQGDVTSMVRLAEMYYERNDFADALVYFRKAADNGYVYVYYNIGAMYHNGDGVQVDHVEAFQWLKKAADSTPAPSQNNAVSQYDVGIYYLTGRGVPTNTSAAFQYIKKAADNGHGSAVFSLAVLYSQGVGCPQNDGLALKYLKKAIDADHVPPIIFEKMMNLREMFAELRSISWSSGL